MTDTSTYSPQGSPVGSYDQSLIPARVTSVASYAGAGGISRMGGVPVPDAITIEWLVSRLAEMTAADYHVNRKFFEGDHWQEATQWTGPRPEPTEVDSRRALAAIQRSFVSRNCIREVVQRSANGVIAREPAWSLTTRARHNSSDGLTTIEDELRTEGEALLTSWWDRVNAGDQIAQCIEKALMGKRAALRLYIPPGVLTQDSTLNIPKGDFEAALDAIELEALEPDEGGVIVDRSSKRRYGTYIYYAADDKQRAELVFVDDVTGDTVIRIIEPDPNEISANRNTATTIVIGSANNPPVAATATNGATIVGDQTITEARLQLGKRLTIHELQLDQLVTEQVRQLQRAVNKALTMGDHNVEVAGFVERTIFNGQMPGHFENDPYRPGRQRFVRDEYQAGGGAVNFINGIPSYDAQGEFKGVATPSMSIRNPSLPDAFERTERMFYAALLDECHQAHYLLAGSEYVSGESRVQSRAEYADALRKVKKQVDATGRWLLETVLSLAAWFAQEPEKYADMRAVFSSRVVVGPATAEAVRTAIELRSAGGLSREGLMERTDVEDIDAEVRRIENETAQGISQPARSSGRPGDGLATLPQNQQGRRNTSNRQRRQNDDAPIANERRNGSPAAITT